MTEGRRVRCGWGKEGSGVTGERGVRCEWRKEGLAVTGGVSY